MKNKIEEKINKLFNGKISIEVENGIVGFIKISGTNNGIDLVLALLANQLKKHMDKEEILFAINLGLNEEIKTSKIEKDSKGKLNELINKLFE